MPSPTDMPTEKETLTVAKLIEHLSRLPGDLPVYVQSDTFAFHPATAVGSHDFGGPFISYVPPSRRTWIRAAYVGSF